MSTPLSLPLIDAPTDTALPAAPLPGLLDQSPDALKAWFADRGQPAMRARQVRRWVLAGLASDVVDLTATVRRRADLPALAAYSSMGVAITSIALGAWLQREVD